jgi:DNA recombination protein RmuC
MSQVLITQVLIFIIGGICGAILIRSFSSTSKKEIENLKNSKLTAEVRLESVASENNELKSKIEDQSIELTKLREQAVAIQSEKTSLTSQIKQHKEDIDKLREQLTLHFENLAHKIFQEKSNSFQDVAKKNIEGILVPVKEKLAEFQKKVDDSFGNHAKEQFALKEEIKRIIGINEKMTLQTEHLTKALKGDLKAQGNWGEVILEKILEQSGLRKDIDYIVQGSGLGLRHPESGQSAKPDVVVMLPDDKHIIIDSKVSLTHYERYCASESQEERKQLTKQFIDSIKTHVISLEQRRYQDIGKLGTPDIVLMFFPIEGAFSLALEQDKSLHSFAWDKKIAIVCPSTLFATLRTIASLWRLELQNRNAIDIAKRGGALYDKIAGFVEDMQKIGDQIEATSRTYHTAMGKLSEGRGNVLRQVETLKQLGAKASKRLPTELLSVEEQSEESSDHGQMLIAENSGETFKPS